ncbi:hypothetical protein BJV78DRAFT_1279557 [Lactifluus subvellereus]|nr:hypothetical protein BJV78DRAFT_1279557 [Lactifluus subvellereus]
MSRLTCALPPQLPGLLCYVFLLIINIVLPLIAIISFDNVARGLEITLVVCNSSAGIILISMLFYKLFMRSCVFNDIKSDRKALFAVALFDSCAAIGWSVRLDKNGLCVQPSGGTGTCHAVLFIVALVFAWISVIVAYLAGVWADHGKKQKENSTLPIHVSRRDISSPRVIHVGQFAGYGPSDESKPIALTDIPLR